MLTFGPPTEAGFSTSSTSSPEAGQTVLQAQTKPAPNPKRSSGLIPVDVKSMKDAIDDLLADIKHEGFAPSSTTRSFPEMEDPFQYRRPITPPEPVHLSSVEASTRPGSSSENRFAPPANYSTKPKETDTRSRSADPPLTGRRRTAVPPSESWKRFGSSTYHFVDDGKCVNR